MKRAPKYMTKPTGRMPKQIGAITLKEVPYKDGWVVDLTWRGADTPSGRGHNTRNNWRLAEALAAKENKRLDEFKEKGAGRYTFKDAAEKFLNEKERLSKIKNSELTADTFETYRNIIESHLIKDWGAVRLGDIEKKGVREWIVRCREKRKHSTTRHRLTLFRQILKYAIEDTNPQMLHTFPLGVSKLTVPGKEDKRAKIPDRSDLETLREYLFGQERPVKHSRIVWSSLKVMVLLGASTGIRAGEVAALTWDSIDRETGEIDIKETLARRAGRKPPKSESGLRKIPTTPRAREIIDEYAELYKELKGKCVGPLLLARDMGPLSSHLVSQRFAYLMKDAGLVKPSEKKPGAMAPKIHFHKLRHWFGSFTTKHTGDIHQVKKWIGHKNASMTLDTYGHHIHDQAAIEKFLKIPDWLSPTVDIGGPTVQPIPELPRLLPAPEANVMDVEVEKVDTKIGESLHIPSVAEPWVQPFVDMLAALEMPIGEAYDWLVPQLDDRRSINDPTKRVTLRTAYDRVEEEFRRLKLPSPKSLRARFLEEKVIDLHVNKKMQKLDISYICKCHVSRVYQILRERGHKENANNPLNRKIDLVSNFGRKPQPKHKEQLKLL